MKIVNKGNHKNVTISHISAGECFKYDNEVYIMTWFQSFASFKNGAVICGIRLSDGRFSEFTPGSLVVPVETEVHVL
jgi:hypothetical protein